MGSSGPPFTPRQEGRAAVALSYVNLTIDLYDGQGNPLTGGVVTFTPSALLLNPGVEIVPTVGINVSLVAGGPQVVKLLATDNAGITPNGWGWVVSYNGVPGNPPSQTILLPFASGASQFLSNQVSVPVVTANVQALPLPSGTPKAGYVPVATGSGENSSWQPGLFVLATLTTAGYTYINGTGNIISYTFPNDGLTHRVLPSGELVVATTQTGGQIQMTYTSPDGVVRTAQLDAGGHVNGTFTLNNTSYTVAPNSTVTIKQNTALQAGAAVLYPELWGS